MYGGYVYAGALRGVASVQRRAVDVTILPTQPTTTTNTHHQVLFDKLPQLEELHVVHVGFLGVFGPCKTIVPDPQAPPHGQLVSQSTCLGNGRRMVERKVHKL